MIKLENEKVLVNIGTGRGARIENFVDKQMSKDWVWRRPGMNNHNCDKTLDLKAGFDDSWAGGWDEVFPNDAPTNLQKYNLVDHGEVWRREWKLEDRTEKSVAFSIDCETYPMSLRKLFSLDEKEAVLRIDYEIENKSDEKLPFIFKLHPALTIEEGDRFDMPESNMEAVALGFSRILGKEEKSKYPKGLNTQGEEVTVNQVLPNDGKTREFVKVSDFQEGRCSLINKKTNTSLTFEFSKEALPYVWQFQSFGGFMGLYVAMLEPTNAGHYDLQEASKSKQCGELEAGKTVKFNITVRIREL